MYLMWDPALPSGCQPASTTQAPNTHLITSALSECKGSIPIPLGYVAWGFSGDAVNTMTNQGNGTQWLLCCGVPGTPAVQSSSSYPQWNYTVTNAANNTQ